MEDISLRYITIQYIISDKPHKNHIFQTFSLIRYIHNEKKVLI